MKYMRQLDGLRLFAVLGVWVQHWLKPPYISPGRYGVSLFFVLSGFLITRILFECRDETGDDRTRSIFSLRQFYIKRFFRIFPLYYVLLLSTFLAGWDRIRDTIYWHIPYLSNVFLSMRGSGYGYITHLWSLAVEEQFYLFWPWLILFLPKRFILPSIFSIFLIAPVFRSVGFYFGLNAFATHILPFGCMDALGAGALLAYLVRSGSGFLTTRIWTVWLPWIGLVLFGATTLMKNANVGMLFVTAMRDFGAVLFFVWLVSKAGSGFQGVTGMILDYRPIAYLGKISYGLYLLHPFVANGLNTYLPHYGIPLSSFSLGARFALQSVVTIGLSILTWHTFERPLINFAKRFPYSLPARNPSEHVMQIPIPESNQR